MSGVSGAGIQANEYTMPRADIKRARQPITVVIATTETRFALDLDIGFQSLLLHIS